MTALALVGRKSHSDICFFVFDGQMTSTGRRITKRTPVPDSALLIAVVAIAIVRVLA